MPATKDVLERVRKLVSLAQSDNEEEARTAAMQAARLMTEHDLTVVPKAEFEKAVEEMREVKKTIGENRQRENTKLFLGLVGGYFAAKMLKGKMRV